MDLAGRPYHPQRINAVGTPRVGELRHELEPHLPELAELRTRAQLERSALYRRLRPELDRVVSGFEWRLDPTASRAHAQNDERIRAAAWNIERGKQFDAIVASIANDPRLYEADLLCLTELDIGMARSGNRNVARELAERLGMAYVFANFHLLLVPGDQTECEQVVENTHALHGCALLSRFPIARFSAVDLPERVDKFTVVEKRLGCKRALLCEVLTPSGPLTVVVPHLDPFADGRYRGRQISRVLSAARSFGSERVLLGGDLNTNTYHLGSASGLVVNFVHKVFRLGVDQAIEQYMTPGDIFERWVFTALDEHGFRLDGFNDHTKGSYHFDINDDELMYRARDYVPGFMLKWIERRLEKWNGAVPMRLDWFAGRGVAPEEPWVIEWPRHDGVRASDHHPIGVTIRCL